MTVKDWSADLAGFRRGTLVTLDKTPGVWSVYGPGTIKGNIWLEPVSKLATGYAKRLRHAMLEAPRELIKTLQQTEGHTP